MYFIFFLFYCVLRLVDLMKVHEILGISLFSWMLLNICLDFLRATGAFEKSFPSSSRVCHSSHSFSFLITPYKQAQTQPSPSPQKNSHTALNPLRQRNQRQCAQTSPRKASTPFLASHATNQSPHQLSPLCKTLQ